jgi:hypothetical protein
LVWWKDHSSKQVRLEFDSQQRNCGGKNGGIESKRKNHIYIYIYTPFGLNDWFIGILEDMKVSFIF